MPSNDFNGDGLSDILWRSDQTGEIYTWITNASAGFADYYVPSHAEVPLGWHVVGLGDFNGDGKTDILWRDDSGLLATWLGQANGGFADNYTNSVVQVPTDWQVQGIGDFNGDGKADILWRNSTGLLATWLGQANGGFAHNYDNSAVQVPTDWQVQGIGDFNGDGKADILWRNSSGLLATWLGQANGGFADNYANSVVQVPTEWQVQAVGDFNGDGKADILWRHDTGVIVDWLGQSNGSFASNYGNSATSVPLTMHVVEIGDFNGDSHSDILWRNDNGDIQTWTGQADGGFVYDASYSIAGAQSTSWHVEAVDLL